MLPALPTLLAFLAAALLLAATPGPGVLYILARTLALGRRAGLLSALAVAAGNLCSAVLAALGLAALLAVSALAFTVLKWAGAAYLVWLGVQALLAPPPNALAPTGAADARVFRDGVLVALLNPKTALFFAAFLPQFVQPAAPALAQVLALSTLFVAVALATDAAYVLLAARLRPRLLGAQHLARAGRWASAGVYFGLGAWAVLAEPRR